jgi:hypothetical protein
VLPSQKSDQDREERDRKRGKTLAKRDEERWSGTALPGTNRRRSRRSLGLMSAGVWVDTFDGLFLQQPAFAAADISLHFGALHVAC